MSIFISLSSLGCYLSIASAMQSTFRAKVASSLLFNNGGCFMIFPSYHAIEGLILQSVWEITEVTCKL